MALVYFWNLNKLDYEQIIRQLRFLVPKINTD